VEHLEKVDGTLVRSGTPVKKHLSIRHFTILPLLFRLLISLTYLKNLFKSGLFLNP
jgi:hypothetical protein